jgi:hypothetical protein
MSDIVPFQFHEDRLDTVVGPEGRGVTLASLCAPFGLDPEWQRQKLVKAEWATTLKFKAVAEDGKTREIVCLDLRSISGWLFTLQTKTLAPDVRAKLVMYQRECADVLADHFLGKRGEPKHRFAESAETFAQQSARVVDDPLVRMRLGLAIRRVANAKKLTWHAVEGFVRTTTFSSGWLHVALFSVPRVIDLLEAIESGLVDMPRRRPRKATPKILPSNVRQLALFRGGRA